MASTPEGGGGAARPYAELEITLKTAGTGAVVAGLRFSPPDSDADVRLDDDVPLSFDVEALGALVVDPDAYGKALGRCLFAPMLARSFTRAREEAEARQAPLQVRLFINRTAEPLHRLRWETLRDPDTGLSLLTDQNILFSRYVDSRNWRPVSPSTRHELNAVVMVANPTGLSDRGLASVEVEEELARARTALVGMNLVELASGGRATLAALADSLRAEPEVVYLVCHGFLANDEPQLLLEKADGSVDRVEGSKLIARLRELPGLPRLVVLASCQSAGSGRAAGDDAPLTALGPRLGDIGVPAVVAMQGNLTMSTAEGFMPAFFTELVRDGQIDRAMAVARGKVRERSDWWMPVLYMRLKSGRLWITRDERGLPVPAAQARQRPKWRTTDPQDLARHVTPDARRWLTLGQSSYDLGESPGARVDTVRAMYDALCERDLRSVRSSERADGVLQEIRTPEQILGAGQEATALDLAVLFCGLCLGNRLLPVLVVLDGHAVVLVSMLHGQADLDSDLRAGTQPFTDGLVADAGNFDRLVQLVDDGSYVAVDCTGFARPRSTEDSDAPAPQGGRRVEGLLAFEQAREAARHLLVGRERFRFALDVGWLQRHAGRVPLMDAPERSSGAAVPREVKKPPRPFVGRDQALDRVRQAVLATENRQVVVICGMPGVGKSALADAFATTPDVEAQFPDGTLFIDLNATDTLTALDHVARAFGQSVAEHDLMSSRIAMVRSILENSRARLLVVLDDAHDPEVIDIFRFCDSGLVVTTVDEQLADEPGTRRVLVDPLSEADAVALLRELIGEPVRRKGTAALERIAALLGGLPLALELAAGLVTKQLEVGWSMDDIVAELEFRRLDLGPRDRPVRAIFDATYERALDQGRRDRFVVLGAFGPGTLDLGAIATAWGVDPASASGDVRALTELSLLASPKRGSYDLQPLLRDYAVSLFERLDPGKQLVVHQRLADHYRRWLRAYEETNQEETLCWYRFEQVDWQEAKARYLFHLSRLPDRVADRLAYTGLFFDAFWWWGSYVRFEYGDQLLVEWERAHHDEDGDDRRWYEAMKTFARSYPLGPDKRGRGRWPSVREGLLEVRALAGLDDSGDSTDAAERRHVRAITDQFLGQCHRYVDEFDEAAVWYRESLQLLEEGGEWWEVAWGRFAFADLELERGRLDEAEAHWRTALALDVEHRRKDLDVELRASLYRIEGDIAWERGDAGGAFGCYGPATFYAYRLQSSAHPPDIYALTFYREMKWRLTARLGQLLSSGGAASVDQVLADLATLWSPYWRSLGVEPPVVPPGVADVERVGEVVEALLPPEPSERKLTAGSVRYRRQFAREAKEHTSAMAAVLDPAAWPGSMA